MSKQTLLACLFALLTWDVLRFAIRRTLLVFAMRRMSPQQVSMLVNPGPAAIDGESLRDEDAFRDGWRACERCRRLPPSIDDDHIMHHYSWDGSVKEKTTSCVADDLAKERQR